MTAPENTKKTFFVKKNKKTNTLRHIRLFFQNKKSLQYFHFTMTTDMPRFMILQQVAGKKFAQTIC